MNHLERSSAVALSGPAANKDPLTGAYNRASLKDQLQDKVGEARRTANPLALIIIDLDHFKSVNDAFGHARGDEVLLEFVGRLSSMIRGTDLLFRYGGDEFVLVMPNTSKDQALVLADRILETIRSNQFRGEPPLSLSLSIGLAEFSEASSAESLFEEADSRLREAKRSGRGCVVGKDSLPAKDLQLGEVSRLVGREAEIELAHRFLESLLEHKRGVLEIRGSSGSGKSRFLAEVGKAAHLRGCEVLALRAAPALSKRNLGALTEAGYEWGGQPLNSTNVKAYVKALPDMLEDQGRLGLLVTVDELPFLDLASLQLVHDLLTSTAVPYLALAYTADNARSQSAIPLEAPLHHTLELRPLSLEDVRIWLREVLQWEPEEEFLQWLYRETGGSPSSLQRGIHYLVEQGVLEEVEEGWALGRKLTSIELSRLLSSQTAPPPNNLPPVRSFVGRDQEIRVAKNLLAENRLVTILGPGGIGKTHLALQLAAESMGGFRNGTFYVSLAALTSPDLLVPTIAESLNYQFLGMEDPKTELLNYLRQKEILLVLDNFEHLLQGAGLIREALDRAPSTSILITSRDPLNLHEEAKLELHGMAIPGDEGEEDPSDFSAVQLFMERASRAHTDFALPEEEKPHLIRICQLVEGIPLGIELAAAWAKVLPCREIEEAIEANLDFLRTSRPEAPDRHRSLRAVFDHFWGSLSRSEQSVLRALSIFRGGFRQEAAETVAGASFFFLSALVDKSLLRKIPQGRYEMHEVLRQYSDEELQEVPDEKQAVNDRYSEYYARFLYAKESGLRKGRQQEALETIGEEIENVRAAWALSLSRGDLDAIHASAESLFRFYDMRNRFQEGEDAFRSAAERLQGSGIELALGRKDKDLILGKILARQGRFSFRLSLYEEAKELLQESLSLLLPADAPQEEAFALNNLGDVDRVQGDYAQANQFHRRALAIYQEIGDQSGVARSLNHLGIGAASLGEFRAAKEHFQRSLDAWRGIGDQWNLANVLNNLGNVASLLGEDVEAKALHRESHELCSQIGDRRGVANALNNLGLVSEAMTEYEAASQLYQESVATYQEIEDQRGVAIALVNLGKVTHKLEEPKVARLLLNEATRTGMAVRATPVVLEALVEIAALLIAEEKNQTALDLLCLALHHAATEQESRDRARTLLNDLETRCSPQAVSRAFDQENLSPPLEEFVGRVLTDSERTPFETGHPLSPNLEIAPT